MRDPSEPCLMALEFRCGHTENSKVIPFFLLEDVLFSLLTLKKRVLHRLSI